MKTKIKILLLLVIVLGMTACEKNFLDVTDPNRVTEDLYWKTEEDAFKVLTGSYAQLQIPLWDRWGNYECKFLVEEYRTDLGIYAPDYDEWVEMFSFNITPENYTSDYYWYYSYQGIYQANMLLENINKCKMDEAKRNQMIAEAKFLRGYFHLKLITYYRNIPLVVKVPKSSEDFYPKQSTPAQVYAQIEKDFSEAANALPANWEDKYLGRATKGAATAYLGVTYLYQNKYQQAGDEFQKIINMGYELMPEFYDNFNGLKENNKESIFEIQFSTKRPNNVSESHTLVAQIASWSQGGPSKWFLDMLKQDKKQSGEYSNRVYGTIFFDDPKTNAFWLKGKTWKEAYGDQVLWKKWVYKGTDGEPSFSRAGNNQVELRFADVLLMYAEAKTELGDLTAAYSAVNRVRQRAGVPDLQTGLSQDQLRQHIRHYERPVELAFEGKRWADLVRWGNIKQTLQNHNHKYADQFDTGKDEYLPIPQIEINNNPNIKQNPGFN